MKYKTVSSLCEGIAESIRRKEGSTEKINPQDFVQRIENLQVGGVFRKINGGISTANKRLSKVGKTF